MRQGMSSARVLTVIMVIMGAAVVVVGITLGIGPRVGSIGDSGLGRLAQIGLLGGAEVGQHANRTGAVGDGRLDIVAVPLIYAPDSATEDTHYAEFQDWVSRLEPRLEEQTPFREASDPASKVSIQMLSPGDVSLPGLSGGGTVYLSNTEIQYATVSCDAGHQAIRQAAESAGVLGDADMVIGWVNGSQGGNIAVLEEPGVSGCADDIGGSLALVEQSALSPDPVGAMMHEFGHMAGLCHNQGVQQSTSGDTLCDLSQSPARPSVCSTRNDERSDGRDSIMNYCQPWEEFTGTGRLGDEYNMLEQYFESAGWLEQR